MEEPTGSSNLSDKFDDCSDIAPFEKKEVKEGKTSDKDLLREMCNRIAPSKGGSPSWGKGLGNVVTVRLRQISTWDFSTTTTTVTHAIGPRTNTIVDFDNMANIYDEYKIDSYNVRMSLRELYSDTSARTLIVSFDRHNSSVSVASTAIAYQNMKWFVPTSMQLVFQYDVPRPLCSNHTTGNYVPGWQPCANSSDFDYGVLNLVPYGAPAAAFSVKFVEEYVMTFRMRR